MLKERNSNVMEKEKMGKGEEEKGKRMNTRGKKKLQNETREREWLTGK